ncbi:MAG: UMP kinase [Desulfobulbaceae bacterium]|nr:UMP kinase [Desulfobulbaceae bacterium]MCK5322835.1 UMP kinase [Desulfobulbaceae bacterium]MCK5437681.1 UMP kinase [Desulfobulbaceae bacterium]
MNKSKYKKILLKLSGEALMGKAAFGISNEVLGYLSDEIRKLKDLGVQMSLVVGAGNIFRGVAGVSQGMDRVSADYMGMLATVMNSLAIENVLDRAGVPARVLSAIPMPTVCETYARQRAVRHLNKGRVVIFAAGTANPYFTTDTAAVLRSLEINAELICKATRVDGVYDKDPLTSDDAVKFDRLSYSEVLKRRLRVMDSTAISLAMENDLPVVVFDMNVPDNMCKAVCGEKVGTLITGEENE